MGNIIGYRRLADECYDKNNGVGNKGVEVGAGTFWRCGIQKNEVERTVLAERDMEVDMRNARPYNNNDIIREAQQENAILRTQLAEIKNKVINNMEMVSLMKGLATHQCDDKLYCLAEKLEEALYRTLCGLARLECRMQEIDAFQVIGD